MKINTLKERIEKATQKIEKKENTIVKKNAQIEKKYQALEKLGIEDPREKTEDDFRGLGETDRELWSNLYWLYADIRSLKEDIRRGGKEIEATKKTLEKYEAQLAGEIEKESIFLTEVPDVFISLIDELVDTWDFWDTERRDRLRKVFKELGSRECFKRGYTGADYEFQFITDQKIHDNNLRDAKMLVLDLYNRVKDITGEVTDWSGIEPTQGTGGFTVLNGVVIGKEGRAKVESILAGGYNIQRLHIRVLVHEIN